MNAVAAVEPERVSLAELAAVAQRRPTALNPLLQRARPILYALILDRIHQPEVAEDLTQEALQDVMQGLPGLREPRAFPAWLRTIALNRCRRWWRREPEETVDPGQDYQRLVHEDAFAEAARGETWRELQRALEDLPEKSRLALLMHVLTETSQAEIAEALDLTAANVAVRIHRARARLRVALRPLTPITEEEWQDAQ